MASQGYYPPLNQEEVYKASAPPPYIDQYQRKKTHSQLLKSWLLMKFN